MKWKYLIICLLFIITGDIYAQRSAIYTSSDREYKNAMELFQKEKYGAAQYHFRRAIELYGKSENELKINSQYYAAICAIELFNNDAEFLISLFIDEHQESNKVNDAYYEMAKFQYREKEYANAINWFDQVEIDALIPGKLPEYYFKSGYSLFCIDSLDKALMSFEEMKGMTSKYVAPAAYYSAHIEYGRGNYETALQEFRKLEKDETFSPIVPYYITQIFYLQKKYEEAIQYAPAILESSTSKREPEIARIIGESYYRMKKYEEAIPYLATYHEKAKNISRQDNYQLAYVYYKMSEYNKADTLFSKVTFIDDSLSQNAYYHLADCYLYNGDKNKARMAFSEAVRLDFDASITEEALFNQALITYELNFSPFNEVVNAFKDFINRYPDSERTDDAYNFLVAAYMYSKNYKEALTSLEKIKIKDHRVKEAYQKVAFYRALELYNNLYYEEAILLFEKSLQYAQFNKTIKARAHYWKAEALYRLDKYSDAIENYNQFLLASGAFMIEEYKLSHYNIGYCYLKKQDYSNSILWFRKYVNIEKNTKSDYVGDAYNRIGDCYFLLRTYWVAIEFYDKAINVNTTDADYALFQRGFALGLVKRPEKKIASLEKLKQNFPNSSYLDDALYEIGRSYMVLQDYSKAEGDFERVVDEYPGSSYVSKSLLQLGLIKYNENKNDEAIVYYKRLVAEFPQTSEAKNALTGIKNVYVDQNNVNAYFTYINGIGITDNVSLSEKDSLTYFAAENVYMSGNFEDSKENFKKYLNEFTNGSFLLNANYYLADCYARSKDYDLSLEFYSFVVDQPKNTFTEQALLGASAINFSKGNYKAALLTYLQLESAAELKSNALEARIGTVRSYFMLNDFVNTVFAANKLLATEKIPSEIVREVNYKKALSFLKLNKLDEALTEFKPLSKDVKSMEGAEAKYRVAEILYLQNKSDLAEHEIFDLVEQNTPYEYWMGKSFILLADIYLKKEDFFQAKPTLQSVMDNYGNMDDGIISLAREKYDIIVKLEQEKLKVKEEEDIEIKL